MYFHNTSPRSKPHNHTAQPQQRKVRVTLALVTVSHADCVKMDFVARRSCARTGMARHSSLNIQDVQKYILLRDVRAPGQGWLGTVILTYRMFNNTSCCETFVRSDPRYHLASNVFLQYVYSQTVKGSNVSGYVAREGGGTVCVHDAVR
jgi:hypothetical protein